MASTSQTSNPIQRELILLGKPSQSLNLINASLNSIQLKHRLIEFTDWKAHKKYLEGTLVLVDCFSFEPADFDPIYAQLNDPALDARVALLNCTIPDDELKLGRYRSLFGVFRPSARLENLMQGISELQLGRTWFSRSVLEQHLAQSREFLISEQAMEYISVDPIKAGSLTRRETQILQSMACGATNDEIAARFSISPNTVRTHIHNTFQKLEVNSRTQAVLWSSINL